MKQILLILLILPNVMLCQDIVNKFTDLDKNIFLQVFFESKKMSVNGDSVVIEILQKHQISLERYSEILKAGLDGNRVEQKSNETEALKVLQEFTQLTKRKRRENLILLCQKFGFEVAKYDEMETKFRSNLDFQNEMKPLLTKFIEKR